MPETQGINHLGLAVRDLNSTKAFFVDALGWEESGYEESYPRTSVSDGVVRLTLWQIDHNLDPVDFHRRRNVGLHHLALQVDSEEQLERVYALVAKHPEVRVEFSPEPVGTGPRKHMMCYEPGGIRIEFIWPGV